MRRILSIDGGGIKGVFPAAFLATVEDLLGESVTKYFDLVVGTSTGGIIAIGLGLGLTAQELCELYLKEGPTIFGGKRLLRKLRWLSFAKYSSKPLRRALERRIGERKLGESSVRLVIPATNLENGKVHIYKTAHLERFEFDYKERAVDVALATAAAPTFFQTHTNPSGVPLIDGGMFANNPTGLAVVEAIGVLGWPRESLQVLSLGCTEEPLDIGSGRRRPWGLIYWATRAVKVMMAAQSSASLGTACVLASHEQVMRISPTVPPKRYALDRTHGLEYLQGLGITAARDAMPELRRRFLQRPADPFVPFKLP